MRCFAQNFKFVFCFGIYIINIKKRQKNQKIFLNNWKKFTKLSFLNSKFLKNFMGKGVFYSLNLNFLDKHFPINSLKNLIFSVSLKNFEFLTYMLMFLYLKSETNKNYVCFLIPFHPNILKPIIFDKLCLFAALPVCPLQTNKTKETIWKQMYNN